jgi:ABC-type oligopeptide transport system substrate-binding subunit
MKRKIGILFAVCCMGMFAFTACKRDDGLDNSTVDDINDAGTDNDNDATDNTIDNNDTTNGTINDGTNGTNGTLNNGTNDNGTVNDGTINNGTTNGIDNTLTPTGIGVR